MSVTLNYMWYGAPDKRTYESVPDALMGAICDIENNYSSPQSIVVGDKVAYNKDQIWDAYFEYFNGED